MKLINVNGPTMPVAGLNQRESAVNVTSNAQMESNVSIHTKLFDACVSINSFISQLTTPYVQKQLEILLITWCHIQAIAQSFIPAKAWELAEVSLLTSWTVQTQLALMSTCEFATFSKPCLRVSQVS